jgi:acylphosphatase
MSARRWLVSGRVQGVGFRAFCLRAATSLQLDGWVRNLPDGRVEVMATGDVDALDGLGDALRRGPTYGRVDHVDESAPDEPLELGPGFDVRFGP